jgi:hypothetical protein
MPTGDNEGVGVGELSRQVRDVLQRLEGLAVRLETQFVRGDNFSLYKQLVDQAILQLQGLVKDIETTLRVTPDAADVTALSVRIDSKASKSELEAIQKRVAELEDDKKWITRLVIAFVVIGIISAVFVVQKVGSGG